MNIIVAIIFVIFVSIIAIWGDMDSDEKPPMVNDSGTDRQFLQNLLQVPMDLWNNQKRSSVISPYIAENYAAFMQ